MDVPSVLVGVALGAAVAGAVSCFAAPHCHGEQKPTADSAWNGNMDNVDEMKVHCLWRPYCYKARCVTMSMGLRKKSIPG